MIQSKQSAVYFKHDILVIQEEFTSEIPYNAFISSINIIYLKGIAYNSKLRSVKSVNMSRISYAFIELSRKALKNKVSEMIAVHFIDFREFRDAEQNDAD